MGKFLFIAAALFMVQGSRASGELLPLRIEGSLKVEGTYTTYRIKLTNRGRVPIKSLRIQRAGSTAHDKRLHPDLTFAQIEPGKSRTVTFTIRGAAVSYVPEEIGIVGSYYVSRSRYDVAYPKPCRL